MRITDHINRSSFNLIQKKTIAREFKMLATTVKVTDGYLPPKLFSIHKLLIVGKIVFNSLLKWSDNFKYYSLPDIYPILTH